jgi:hypothetical protein
MIKSKKFRPKVKVHRVTAAGKKYVQMMTPATPVITIEQGEDIVRTSSDAKTFEMELNASNKEHKEIVIYAIYEVVPTDGGDCKRLLTCREREEDAKAIVKVLTETDVNWGLYVYERKTYDCSLSISVSSKETCFDRITRLLFREVEFGPGFRVGLGLERNDFFGISCEDNGC